MHGLLEILYRFALKMRFIVLFIVSLLVCACAPSVYDVRLSPPNNANEANGVHVKDARLDKDTYLTSITSMSSVHMYLLDPQPPLDVTLRGYIDSKLSASQALGKNILVSMKRLEIKDEQGLITAKLNCDVESQVSLGDTRTFIVQTSTAQETMSEVVASQGAIILEHCLAQHATDIVERLKHFLTKDVGRASH